MFTSLPLLLSLSIGSILAIARLQAAPFIFQTTNDSGAGYQSAHNTKARSQRQGRPDCRLRFVVVAVSTFSYCSHFCGFKWPGRLAAVCALSEWIMNKGQLTTLIVSGPQVEHVASHDALSSGLAARYLVIEAECGPRAQIMPLAGRVIANWRFKNSDGRDRNRGAYGAL